MTYAEAIAELVQCRLQGHKIASTYKVVRGPNDKVIGNDKGKYCVTCARLGLPHIIVYDNGKISRATYPDYQRQEQFVPMEQRHNNFKVAHTLGITVADASSYTGLIGNITA